jgi:hypothetical protein
MIALLICRPMQRLGITIPTSIHARADGVIE